MPAGGTPIGAALGPDVGPRLGTLLGTDVGATLGGVLGGNVGPAVGTALGAEACATVADADGAARYVNVEVGAELAHAVNIRTEAARRATLRRSRASWTTETSPSRVDDGTSRRPDCLMVGIALITVPREPGHRRLNLPGRAPSLGVLERYAGVGLPVPVAARRASWLRSRSARRAMPLVSSRRSQVTCHTQEAG